MKKVLLLILSFASIAHAGESFRDFLGDGYDFEFSSDDEILFKDIAENLFAGGALDTKELAFENATIEPEPVGPVQALPNYPNDPFLTNDGPASLDFEIYDYGIIQNNSTREGGPEEIGSVLDIPFGAFENTDNEVLSFLQDANQGEELQAGVNEYSRQLSKPLIDKKVNKILKCSECDYQTIDYPNFARHKRIHTGEKPYKCDECSILFTDLSNRKRHMHLVHKLEYKKPQKRLSHEVFEKEEESQILTNDVQAFLHFGHDDGIIEDDSTKKVGPEEIGSVLDTPFGAFENTDSGVLPISQDANQGEELCAGVNEDSRQLSKPLIDKQKNKKIFECIECGKIFPRNSNLIVHIHRHREEKPHKCDKCGKAFVTSGDLSRHIKIHAEVKFYQCDTCLMEFADPSNCRRHMKTHAEVKSYQCDECPMQFADHSSRKRHMRVIHKPEVEVQIMPDIAIGLNKTFDQQVNKILKCSECDYQTIDYRNFVRHKRIHTGEKRFKCNQCARAFTDSTSCKRHMKLVHNLEYEKPQKCLSHEVFEQEEESQKEDSDYLEKEEKD